eukprot:gene15608-18503_t
MASTILPSAAQSIFEKNTTADINLDDLSLQDSKDYYIRTRCRLCGSEELTPVLSLTPTPPANAFINASLLGKTVNEYPLDVSFCEDCTHLQLVNVIDPEILFKNYVYVSGATNVMIDHMKNYAADVLKVANVHDVELVVEFGSNDGTLLRFFKESGHKVLGIDPAENLAAAASASGIPTIPSLFNLQCVRTVLKEHGKAKLICANHCCAHIDNLTEVFEAVRELMSPDGLWVFEVGYLLDVYTKALFDTIYHEHLDFHTVLPLQKILKKYQLQLVRADRVDIQGGALRCFVRHIADTNVLQEDIDNMNKLIQLEAAAGLHASPTFLNWGAQIDTIGLELRALLLALKANGKTIAGYGAPAKATTLMYHFGFTSDNISYIVDDNPLKQGLYTPGLNIPVVSSSKLREDRPDYVIILAWNFADSVIEQ